MISRITVFESAGSSHYRVPGVVVTGAGSVLAFANRRLETHADDAAEVEVVMRRDRSGRGAFDAPKTLAAEPGWRMAICGAVVDLAGERVLLHYAAMPGDEVVARGETAGAGYRQLVSRNDGAAFEMMPAEFIPGPHGVVGSSHGSGSGIALRTPSRRGRLVMPARIRLEAEESAEVLQRSGFNCVIYSDDAGRSWRTGDLAQAGTGEAAVAELSDGRLYLNSRAYFADGHRRTAISRDGGAHFGDFAVDPALEEPRWGCAADVVSLPAATPANPGADPALVYVGVAGFDEAGRREDSSSERRRLTAHLSYDEGQTWSRSRVIHEGPAAYASLALDAQRGELACLFECGEASPYERIDLCRFDLQWLDSGAPAEARPDSA